MSAAICRFFVIPAILAITQAAAWAEDGVEFFEKKIRPVLSDQCYQCHGAEKQKGGLRLDDPGSMRGGGDSGPVFVAGKAEESLLITALRYHDKDMQMPPPKDGVSRKLPDAQIDDFVTWINLGAPLPHAKAAVSNGPHWAFEPLGNPAPPAVQDARWGKTEIDAFILSKLESAGLQPSKPADQRTLIRRATFDLTGLPPTAEEVQAFAEDDSPDAFAKVVDRLLASPRYGERWGRHWLDLARYSDTKGYVYGREERFFVHAYAYRDWVIRALNSDLPYDRFLLLQIAADQLVPDASPDLAAMGFLTGGRRFTGVTHEIIDDRIDVVTRGTMALTVQCARCHDHKYDPIPTRDYYALYGVFQSSAERLVCIESEPGAGEPFAAYKKGYDERAGKLANTMRLRREEAGSRLRDRVGDYLTAQLELQKYPEEGFDQILAETEIIPASVRRWRDFLDRTKGGKHPIFAPWHALAALPDEDFERAAPAALARLTEGAGASVNPLILAAFATPPKSRQEVAERYGGIFTEVEQQWKAAGKAEPSALSPHAEALRQFLYDPASPTAVPDLGIVDNELFFPTSACEELWKLQGELDRWIINTPGSLQHALVLVDREPEANPRVFKRGNPARRAEEVPRQFLSVVAGPEPKPFQTGSGRLELAQAIVRPDNPLTARVAVNRIWMHHFGAGLVRTPSDFGVRAEPPSHPELLDWLAQRFLADGWSLKKLHRLILLSAVYQQSSDPRPEAGQPDPRQVDPGNRLLSHFNRQRLDFEQMRDALLAASGELDTNMGGKPGDMFSEGMKRRSVYGLVDRQFVPATFRVFDFASPDTHVDQRHETTVPQQGLFFLNHQFVAARAKALLAREPVAQAPSPEERVQRLYEACFQRAAKPVEAAAALRFIAAAEVGDVPSTPSEPLKPWEQLSQVLLLANEFAFID